MPNFKKNQMNQVMFPMVDKTDFATIESAITASDFNSAATKKFFGVNHGVSDAFTSGTISKAATLVHSGIFQQTLKAAECNYDYLIIRYSHPSCADQILIFQPQEVDPSDMYSLLSDLQSDFQSRVPKAVATQSLLSDVNSNLLSYLLGMSGMLSDVDSALSSQFTAGVGASDMSDIASRVWATAIGAAVSSRILLIQSNISDVESQLDLNASMISDVQSALDSQFAAGHPLNASDLSDLRSAIAGVTASVSASDMSDIASRVWATAIGAAVSSRIALIQSNVSDVESQLDLNASMISDVQSALDSQFAAGHPLNASDMSDLRSAIAATTAAVSASDMSDIASRVWATAIGAAVSSRILLIQSNISDVESQLDLNASMISDVQSALDSQFAAGHPLNASDMSDLRSAIAGVTASVSASDMSDIASRVWATAIGAAVSSRIALIQSNVSDVESQLDLNASMISDVQSALDSQFAAGHPLNASDLSDLRSAIAAVTAAVSASDMSDIASRVWATAAGAAVSSRIVLIQSNVSDVESQLDLNASMISDVQSALDSQFAAGHPLTASDLSDLRSAITAGGLSVSNISDIASAVKLILASDLSDILSAAQQTNSRALVVQSMVSDVESQLDLNASMISDVQSALDSQLAAGHPLNASDMSDLRSAIAGVTASVSASDMSDIASRVWATAIGAAVSSRIVLIQSNVSDIESALDSQFVWNSGFLSDMNSDLGSKIGAVSVTLTASDISDIASAVAAAVTTVTPSDISDIASAVRALLVSDLSDILSAAQQTNSRVLVNQSRVSDIYSLLSDVQSDFQSRVPKAVATNSQLSDLTSDLRSYLVGMSGMLSDVDSALTSQFTAGHPLNASDLSDLRSAIAAVAFTLGASDISDIASAVKVILASDLSDILSAAQQANSRVLLNQSRVSDIYSLLSDVQSDFQSRVPKLVANNSQLSDLTSDLRSYLAGMSGVLSDVYSNLAAGVTVGASSLSDLYSQVWDTAEAELAAVPAANAGYGDKLAWLFALSRNKRTATSAVESLRNDGDSADIASAAVSDDGTTFTKGEWA